MDSPPVVPGQPCPAVSGRIACVDLSHQRMWVQQGNSVVFGPVHIRSGRAGEATRTGMKRIYRRSRNEYSTLYNAPMPYAQYFDQGIAFHGVSDSTYVGSSRGCVNLSLQDAARLWGITRVGDPVFVWGRKPGT